MLTAVYQRNLKVKETALHLIKMFVSKYLRLIFLTLTASAAEELTTESVEETTTALALLPEKQPPR